MLIIGFANFFGMRKEELDTNQSMCYYSLNLLGPVYTKHQSQRCENPVMTLVILFSWETVESLQNGVETHFLVTPLYSMRTVLLVSSQIC